ncbi:MAG: hypothetical protein E7012_02720 [Alphaproteobacteria bacterium]|nr:hypothetical protein [Alphaproteobacteria bacterium]
MWANKSSFYHIYPLGFCGCTPNNDYTCPPTSSILKVYDWIPHIKSLGCNAVYFGPVFESVAHGYDTKDYFKIDCRLGDNQDFKALVSKLHSCDIKVVLDGVFNHVGRDFFAFEDVKHYKASSQYCSWFKLNFNHNNRYNDGFCYEGWDGCEDLVKLNLTNPEVKEYLLSAVAYWIDEFDIDGLRLDVAHYLTPSFIHELRSMCLSRKSDFWLLGEMVFGNYNRLVNPGMLDSCTNYELYKALYSSCNDGNLHELSHTLNRQFGANGIYRGLNLYSFLDNHDVSRIASVIKNPLRLKPLYGLLYTLPGIASVYYGSEWGATGVRERSDSEVRNSFDAPQTTDLTTHISWWTNFRNNSKILSNGQYQELEVRKELLFFKRYIGDEELYFGVNIGAEPQEICYKNHNISIPAYSIEIINF